MKLEFNKDEAQALLTLIDLAVKSAGLNVAGAAASLAEKIANGLKDDKAMADGQPKTDGKQLEEPNAVPNDN